MASNATSAPTSTATSTNHAPLRTRKLLMHKEEIRKLIGKTQQKGPHPDPRPHVLQEWQSKRLN